MKKQEPDQMLAHQIGKVVQAARKHLGINQTALAPQLGIDQSGLSRVESGRQALTAVQWFIFCNLAGISPDSALLGSFELSRPESAMRLPSRYSFESHSKVRSLLPLLHFAQSSMGERAFGAFLEEKRIPDGFFLNLNARINFNFTLDLLAALAKRTGISSKDAEGITRTASESASHGELRKFYEFVFEDPLKLISAFVDHSDRYNENFTYEITDSSPTHVDLSVTPNSHMREFGYLDNEDVSELLAHYEKGFFQHFSAYRGQKPLKVHMLESLYRGEPRSLYRMKHPKA